MFFQTLRKCSLTSQPLSSGIINYKRWFASISGSSGKFTLSNKSFSKAFFVNETFVNGSTRWQHLSFCQNRTFCLSVIGQVLHLKSHMIIKWSLLKHMWSKKCFHRKTVFFSLHFSTFCIKCQIFVITCTQNFFFSINPSKFSFESKRSQVNLWKSEDRPAIEACLDQLAYLILFNIM